MFMGIFVCFRGGVLGYENGVNLKGMDADILYLKT